MSKHTANSIQDILQLASQYGMPLERMRFFIGVNNTEPKCFGIYQDDAGYWVVYKNKANGERAVRYRGRDEAEASQIIWDKIEEEIKKRKKEKDWWQHQQDLANDPEYAEEYERELENRVLKPRYGTRRNQPKNKMKTVMTSVFIIAMLASAAAGLSGRIRHSSRPSSGYYTHDSELYYYQYPSWYIWDSYAGDWDTYDYDAYYDNDWHDWNYDGRYYVYEGEDDNYYSFQNSDYFNSYSSSSSSSSDYDSDWSSDWDSSWDSDDDYDYDYSDWDSSDTDWDSDW